VHCGCTISQAAAEAAATATAASAQQHSDAEAALAAATTHTAAYNVVVQLLKDKLGAAGVYLAKEVAAANSTTELRYLAAASGSGEFAGKKLSGGAADDESAEGEEGVTFR
jgi:hypothetical protein